MQLSHTNRRLGGILWDVGKSSQIGPSRKRDHYLVMCEK